MTVSVQAGLLRRSAGQRRGGHGRSPELLVHTFSQPALLGRAVRQVRLRALLSDGTSWERLYTFKESLSTRDAARRPLRSKLDLPNGLPPAPLEELALELLGLGGEAARQTGLFVARARSHAIAEAARQLRARYGRLPLYHAVEVEPWSRIPNGAGHWSHATSDPIGGLRRQKSDLRPLNAPSPLRVQARRSGPHRLALAAGPPHPALDRRHPGPLANRRRMVARTPLSRTYYAVVLDDGALLTIYHDHLSDLWFEQRV